MVKTALIDYGMGNLKSVSNAVEYLGYEIFISNNQKEIEKADALILPGVGAFGEAIKNLKELNLDKVLHKLAIEKKIPLLGICLGMQILGDSSNEGGINKGLGLIPGKVKKIPVYNELSLPHIGWNNLNILKEDPIFKNMELNSSFYFVHSFRFECSEEYVSSKTSYGCDIVSSIQKNNIFGVQFHPEKSHKKGLFLLKNFMDYVHNYTKI